MKMKAVKIEEMELQTITRELQSTAFEKPEIIDMPLLTSRVSSYRSSL